MKRTILSAAMAVAVVAAGCGEPTGRLIDDEGARAAIAQFCRRARQCNDIDTGSLTECNEALEARRRALASEVSGECADRWLVYKSCHGGLGCGWFNNGDDSMDETRPFPCTAAGDAYVTACF